MPSNDTQQGRRISRRQLIADFLSKTHYHVLSASHKHRRYAYGRNDRARNAYGRDSSHPPSSTNQPPGSTERPPHPCPHVHPASISSRSTSSKNAPSPSPCLPRPCATTVPTNPPFVAPSPASTPTSPSPAPPPSLNPTSLWPYLSPPPTPPHLSQPLVLSTCPPKQVTGSGRTTSLREPSPCSTATPTVPSCSRSSSPLASPALSRSPMTPLASQATSCSWLLTNTLSRVSCPCCKPQEPT